MTGRPSGQEPLLDTGKITVILIFMTEHYLTSANSHIARKSGARRSDDTRLGKAIIRGQEKQEYGA